MMFNDRTHILRTKWAWSSRMAFPRKGMFFCGAIMLVMELWKNMACKRRKN